jgi:beta-lactamase class A
LAALVGAAAFAADNPMPALPDLSPGSPSTPDSVLQQRVEAVDADLRARLGMGPDATAVGVLDLRTGRLALVRPDGIFYAASVPKILILLGWFEAHPRPEDLDAATRHELGLVIKQSSNELAAKYSAQLGLGFIRQAADRHGLYDAAHGGGLWLGKHYGKDGERIPDPVGGHSHAATARQVLRFYLLLEQGKLVSPAASAAMREIFASPDIPHKDDRFVAGLAGRGLEIRRKAGWWEDWHHDSAAVTGPDRHYLIVALTHHARGEEYLRAFATTVDDILSARP